MFALLGKNFTDRIGWTPLLKTPRIRETAARDKPR
jgi:hypothetical protein